ncbi:TIGR04283 family arsenosugar biosynthesis glycosyltransferase [Psychroserpens sp. XS_ASV72]|uniref:TIGR04283 family arsenosugar biosynthesis glycosyltransferase n=1 Tax=Psychroserpens sp. XS_ASV72 TaxID=3241293 RepID=UPI0035198F4B
MIKISVIIPVLNEAETIGKLILYLTENAFNPNTLEFIIVDGGSTDDTSKIVNDFDAARLLHSEKGRAKQMNFGAQKASGTILYFLHADSFPPKYFDRYILEEVEKENLAGCFRMQFDSNHWWLRLASWFTQFSWKVCRGGDQSLFVSKNLFEDIGGYDENYIIYEDNVLIDELYKQSKFVVINKKIKSSARRYEKQGIWKLQFHFWVIHLKKSLGASADDLYAYYKKHLLN